MMKITDRYIDVLTEGEWWDYIPDDSSDMELRLLEMAVNKMAGIASRLTFCGSKAFLCYTTDNKAMAYIQCGNFNSTGINTECYAQQQPWRYKTADEAAEAWNRRNKNDKH